MGLLADRFTKYFSLQFAHTESLKERAFEIRHQVYCEELGWEPTNPTGKEMDPYDGHSLHCLLRHNPSDRFIGCIRLVNSISVLGSHSVPSEFHLMDQEDPEYGGFNYPKGLYGEVSRLAIIADFRRRQGERGSPFPQAEFEEYKPCEEERRSCSYMAFGLYLSGIVLSSFLKHQYFVATMEPKLHVHLRRAGLRFRQVSPLFDFNGQRAVYCADRIELINGLNEDMRELLSVIQYQLKRDLVADAQHSFPDVVKTMS
ncbi:PEP-CTERM/exosortase system-associated acyltransferase [Oleiphilus messinensis]|uniref:PEP-CTERM/exosortase system-associated acyltransferase n=1 Tax=Oleiphilus messinensis TaxID=141451 RepID=A0A1Y0IC25_9GAMM|nr:PEP-CTERM/exosortase system-associated acyltransferase [Oleiphilus messinensis]ARU56954.1 PEP-CTERM/exosortase system-associated acyltransferase [Oleiphilus messinensis]